MSKKQNEPFIKEMLFDAKTRNTLKATGLRNFSAALRLLGIDFTACVDHEFALGLAQRVQQTLANPTSWQDVRQSGSFVADFHRKLRDNFEYPALPSEPIPPEPATEWEDAPAPITTRTDDPADPIEATPDIITDEQAEARRHDTMPSTAPEIGTEASSTEPIVEQMESPTRKRLNPFESRANASPSLPSVLDGSFRRSPGRPPKTVTASSN